MKQIKEMHLMLSPASPAWREKCSSSRRRCSLSQYFWSYLVCQLCANGIHRYLSMNRDVNAVYQVLAASQRVMQLRSSVPVALSENLREKLEQCRPSLEPSAAAGAPEADAQQDTGECNEAALSPAPAELQGSFASAVLKMPTLRSGAHLPCSTCMHPYVF